MLSEWTSDMDLEDIVMGLLYLMQNPQLDDPLNSMFDGGEKYDRFVKTVSMHFVIAVTVYTIYSISSLTHFRFYVCPHSYLYCSCKWL